MNNRDIIAAWFRRSSLATTADLPTSHDVADALLRRLTDEGLVVVPRKATEAMVIAGCRHENMGDMAGRWDAMVREATKP